jgi:hypothetical protein
MQPTYRQEKDKIPNKKILNPNTECATKSTQTWHPNWTCNQQHERSNLQSSQIPFKIT